jgi:membrane protease YdiL (CAAX protease family)
VGGGLRHERMKSIFANLVHRITWQRVPIDKIEFKALDKETSFLLGYAMFYIVIAYAIGKIIYYYPNPILGAVQFNQDVWYSFVFKILLLLIIPSYVFFMHWKYSLHDLLLGFRPTIANSLALIVTATMGFFLNASHLDDLGTAMQHAEQGTVRLLLGIAMPLFTAALPEEFFFRGYLQTRLEKKWNRSSSMIIATLLFTAWHLPSRYLLSKGVEGQAGDWGEVIVHTGIPVFIIGFIFALHWSRYRNILLLVMTHWAIDILPAISSYFKIPF